MEELKVIKKLETFERRATQTGGSKHSEFLSDNSGGESFEKYQTIISTSSTRFRIVLGTLQIRKTATMMNSILHGNG
jgi:hypothetical protein